MKPWWWVQWLGVAGLSVASAQEALRQWTSQEGRTLEAALVSADETRVYLRRADGTVAEVAPARLAEADQQYVRRWVARHPLPPRLPEWVGVDPATLPLRAEGRQLDSGLYRWEAEHFRIESEAELSPALVREVAVCLEAVRTLFQVLPWGITPATPPGGRHQVTLLATREAYLAAGGPEGSAGVYHGRGRRLLLPLESLGWQERLGRWEKGPEPQWDVLIHELSHQMMHSWLEFLPQWVNEGMAEYVRLLPYRDGKFHTAGAARGLAAHLEYRRKRVVGGVPPPFPLEKLLSMSRDDWSDIITAGGQTVQSVYFTSYLLVYFFMHLDGRGDGRRFLHYLRAVSEAVSQWETYTQAREEGRSFRDLPPPPRHLFGEARAEWMRHNHAILLGGRSEAALMQEVRVAFRRLGVTL